MRACVPTSTASCSVRGVRGCTRAIAVEPLSSAACGSTCSADAQRAYSACAVYVQCVRSACAVHSACAVRAQCACIANAHAHAHAPPARAVAAAVLPPPPAGLGGLRPRRPPREARASQKEGAPPTAERWGYGMMRAGALAPWRGRGQGAGGTKLACTKLRNSLRTSAHSPRSTSLIKGWVWLTCATRAGGHVRTG